MKTVSPLVFIDWVFYFKKKLSMLIKTQFIYTQDESQLTWRNHCDKKLVKFAKQTLSKASTGDCRQLRYLKENAPHCLEQYLMYLFCELEKTAERTLPTIYGSKFDALALYAEAMDSINFYTSYEPYKLDLMYHKINRDYKYIPKLQNLYLLVFFKSIFGGENIQDNIWDWFAKANKHLDNFFIKINQLNDEPKYTDLILDLEVNINKFIKKHGAFNLITSDFK